MVDEVDVPEAAAAEIAEKRQGDRVDAEDGQAGVRELADDRGEIRPVVPEEDVLAPRGARLLGRHDEAMRLERLDERHERLALLAGDLGLEAAHLEGAAAGQAIDKQVEKLGDVLALEEEPRRAALQDDAVLLDQR